VLLTPDKRLVCILLQPEDDEGCELVATASHSSAE
jgi:hypothetical protein